MADDQALVWISGRSGGIGAALAASVPWGGARVVDISRSGAKVWKLLDDGDVENGASPTSAASPAE